MRNDFGVYIFKHFFPYCLCFNHANYEYFILWPHILVQDFYVKKNGHRLSGN